MILLPLNLPKRSVYYNEKKVSMLQSLKQGDGIMKWHQIREAFPHQWVLVESINAFTSDEGYRQIDELLLVQAYGTEWQPAWEGYKQAKLSRSHAEYYMLHTDRLVLEIEVIDRFGRRLNER